MTNIQPSNNETTSGSLYDLVGGEAGVLHLVNVFYDIVEAEPFAHKLLLLHLRGNGVAHSRVEQFNFLSGFLGGPKLYVEKHGHSNIRTMHEHVEINAESKDIWLECMSLAIDQIELEAPTKNKLMCNFTVAAERLVNRSN
jgi:hemoglobin